FPSERLSVGFFQQADYAVRVCRVNPGDSVPKRNQDSRPLRKPANNIMPETIERPDLTHAGKQRF
ncbi:MAG TPA: hypothetical protein VE689_05230, partial [Candidatus Udaeobacter sp.]|nr:hypothetical protein [Candidatus Udaeobacter sp.]